MADVRRTVVRLNADQKPLSNDTSPGVKHNGIVN